MTDWFREWRALAPLSRIGLLILLVGALSDTLAHLRASSVATMATGFTPQQHLSHVVIFIGMLFILLGIVLNAVWPPRRAQPPDTQYR